MSPRPRTAPRCCAGGGGALPRRATVSVRHPVVSLAVVGLLVHAVGAFSPREASAQSADPWAGVRVMARVSGTKLKVGPAVSATLNGGSVFRVDRVSGDWLWVDSGNIRGWVKKADVVPFDQAIAYFSDVIVRAPGDAFALMSRGIARHAARQYEGAVADYTAAIRLDPKDSWSYHDRAAAQHALRAYDKALVDADEAVSINPAEPAHLANRASIRFALKDYERAVADYSEALGRLKGGEASLDDSGDEGEPGRTSGRLCAVKWTCARAECWAARNSPDKAVADYAEALRLDPNDFATFNSLAWLLSTCSDSHIRDARRALELAARACDLTGYKNHLCLDTLAAACAEGGDFTTAVRWLNRAVELTTGDTRFVEGYRARLKLFQEKTPYHEPLVP